MKNVQKFIDERNKHEKVIAEAHAALLKALESSERMMKATGGEVDSKEILKYHATAMANWFDIKDALTEMPKIHFSNPTEL